MCVCVWIRVVCVSLFVYVWIRVVCVSLFVYVFLCSGKEVHSSKTKEVKGHMKAGAESETSDDDGSDQSDDEEDQVCELRKSEVCVCLNSACPSLCVPGVTRRLQVRG